MRVHTKRGELDADDRARVTDLATKALAEDGAPALSDAVLLGGEAGMIHLLLVGEDDPIGYAAVDPTTKIIEIVVDPDRRGVGAGAELLATAIEVGGRSLWTRGDRPTPHQLAKSAGMVPVRRLWCMSRPLPVAQGPAQGVPAPYRLREFVDDVDTEELLAVNSAAFTDLPDQGSWGPDDLAARQSAQWYDPGDVILLERDGRLDGFHWTKVHQDGITGEVYVLALHPRVQGRGLAGPLLDQGLAHLSDRGCTKVLLYVDEENEAARRLYRSHGFVDERLDVLYQCAGRGSAED
jgi:mycothiol synthase